MDDAPNIAIFCDFENVAIGVRDANHAEFNIHLVLERLLDKGKIVVKKAYADWERYRSAKKPMHEAAFELIEIPHVSFSGKNSADIRMVVDALDLCYTKAHVDLFVIISGDSDFSPLVSKLRENNKKVVGLGVKQSTSDLLVDNCDDFIYYDDLLRDRAGSKKSKGARRSNKAKKGPSARPAAHAADRNAAEKPADDKGGEQKPEGVAEESEDKTALRQEAVEMVLETVESLFRERDDNLWGSMVKQTLKRKKPNFSESYHGYRNFNQLLEAARDQGLLEIQKDEKSGGYLITSFGPNA